MLTIQDHARLASVGPVDPEVQEAYLKGRYFWSKHTEGGDRKSREYFQRAIDKDPHFAPAHAGMADSYVSMSNEGGLLPPGQAYSSAKAAALRALELDDRLAQAHIALAKVAIFHEWDWETADRELRRAIELNPGDPEAHIRSATLLVVQGRTEQAIERARVALAQDPLSLWMADALASLYWVARRFDEAIGLCRRTLEMEPQRSVTLMWLGKAYLGKGDYDEAITHLEKAVTLSTDGRAPWSQLAGAYAMAGRRDEARRLLGKESEPTLIAHVHAALGEKDEAFAFLEKAFETRDHRLVWLKTEQAVDSLRSDPRFSDLLRRLNLPE
jgi:tetratricopeptide (TPR) repeat protein